MKAKIGKIDLYWNEMKYFYIFLDNKLTEN